MNENIILQNLQQKLSGIDCLAVAYSGGLDSTVLLHWLSQQALALNLVAVHINHGLSPQSDAWQAHCEAQCKNLSVKCLTKKVVVKKTGKGIEAAARAERYSAIASLLDVNSLLLTAHHLSDQSETFLLRLLRGSGIKGLASMRQSQSFHSDGIDVFRPFLNLSRSELEAYAARHQLQWIEDESNTDTSFDRNYLRASILPLVKQRWPEAENQISAAVQRLEHADRLLDEYANEDLKACDLQVERVGQSIALEKFLQYSRIRQRHIIRVWMASCNLLMPNAEHLEQLFNLIHSAEDAQAVLSMSGREFRRFNGKLYLIESLFDSDTVECDWNGVDELTFSNGFRLSGSNPIEGEKAGQKTYQIRWRSAGIRCKPRERAHSQTLKKLFQEYTIEPWLRSHVPLIYRNEKLIAVGDLWRTDVADEGELTSLVWQYAKDKG